MIRDTTRYPLTQGKDIAGVSKAVEQVFVLSNDGFYFF